MKNRSRNKHSKIEIIVLICLIGIGISTVDYLLYFRAIEKKKDGYFVKVPNREIELKDDLPYLEYFAGGNSVIGFMADESVWGEDLTKYDDFAKAVEENVAKIKNGICLI